MTSDSAPSREPLVVGIEGGATRTTVLAMRGESVATSFQLGAANVIMPEGQLRVHFRDIAARLGEHPDAVGIGLAGARSEAHRELIRRLAGECWPGVPVLATNDLETPLAAVPPSCPEAARVLVLSGTGSCCFGRAADGHAAKIGGRGHIIGDRASAADIGRQALRAVVARLDRTGQWGILGGLILHSLELNDPEDLIPWSVTADKTRIAALAMCVFRAAALGDYTAVDLLDRARDSLVEDGLACAHKLATPGQPVDFILNGGVFAHNAPFAAGVAARLTQRWPGSSAAVLSVPGARGAAELARPLLSGEVPASLDPSPPLSAEILTPSWIRDMALLAQSPTERRNRRSATLDTMPLAEAAALMLEEEANVHVALSAEIPTLTRVVEAVARAFQNGGRLFYTGAGTSGRLGVLDASEIPPTFRVASDMVQGIIAGGQTALWSAAEGAEDDAGAGARAMVFRNAGAGDVVIGIAASGRTPFVWGSLAEARKRGAFTVLLCFNPAVKDLARAEHPGFPDEIIAPDPGPEILTGSTRLKAGTATKLTLNLITTLAMTRVGKVAGNLMIDLNPTNEKLRDRAARILTELTGVTAPRAWAALEEADWNVPLALNTLRDECEPDPS